MTPTFTRRQMLRTIGGGFSASGLAGVLAREALADAANPLAPRSPDFAPKAKRVIFLFMNGGPSHIDTFDPKPDLTKHHGEMPPNGLQAQGAVQVEGARPDEVAVQVREAWQEPGSKSTEASSIPNYRPCIDDLCIIRSMATDVPNHEPALLMMNSGQIQPTRPSLGSWLTYGLGTENQNLPGFVVLCPGKPVVGPALWSNSFLPGIYQGTHINNKGMDPKTIIPDVNNTRLPRDAQRRQLDLLNRMNTAHRDVRGDADPNLEARIASLEMAFRMQFEAQDAFDLGKESKATREAYGKGEFADACLIARRLAERGVRITQVYYGNDQPWDDHADILNHRKHAGG